MNRRELMAAAGGLVGAALFTRFASATGRPTGGPAFEVSFSDAEWKKRLTPAEYHILRRHGTEPPYSSKLLGEKRAGVYVCAGCDLPVYRSVDKYDSRTGWPSFVRGIKGNIGTSSDRSLGMVRTELHCRRCGGHLGHIFSDGPPPTGKRHCINGDALDFVAAKKESAS